MDVKYLRRCEQAKTKIKTNKLALNECFRSSCRNILILNVLFMVCGAMARGGGGGGWGDLWRSGILYGPKFDHPYDPPWVMAKLI